MGIAIEEKYELELKPLTIAGRHLDIYVVSQWDQFVERLEEKEDAYIERFPFWVKIWEASIVLADHLMRLSLPLDKTILEIGAGMGLVGLFLGAHGHHVTITDYQEDVLALLRKNVAHNDLKNVAVKRLDWFKPEIKGPFDIICGSELIYKESFMGPIMDLFHKYLRPHGKIYLSHDYSRKCLMQFIGLIPGNFHIENVIKTMTGNDEKYRIVVHTLKMK